MKLKRTLCLILQHIRLQLFLIRACLDACEIIIFQSKEDLLLSTTYDNNKTPLQIQCGICSKIYFQTYDRYKRSHRHNGCTSTYIKPIILKPIICLFCKKEFQPVKSVQQLCSVQCAKFFQKTPERRLLQKDSGSVGGRISAAKQVKRSKAEIYLAELCIEYFGEENIATNDPFFKDKKGNGWDADIIIHSKKTAILYNGIWHYKKITKTHSLEQMQARDAIKTVVIENNGYVPYVVKDLGKFNKKFVEEAFQLFLFSLINY